MASISKKFFDRCMLFVYFYFNLSKNNLKTSY